MKRLIFAVCATALALDGMAQSVPIQSPDAAALWARLESTPKGREILHGNVISNSTEQVVDTNALISVKTNTTLYTDGHEFVEVVTNKFAVSPSPSTTQAPKPAISPERYQEILTMREKAGWMAKPPEARPPQVKIYSVMRCVMAAKQAGVWDDRIKPYLAEVGLLDLIYTAQDFRSDDPNFTAAIAALENLGITRETIEAALKSAEVKK